MLSAGSCVYTNATIRLLLTFFLNKQSRRRRSDFHRLASIFLPWCSRVIFKTVQERSTYTWPGLARGRTRLPKPNWASTLLGTQPSTTRVSIPARTDWCLSLHRQRACGRQRAIRCLKVRSFRRGTNTRYVLFDILDVSTRGSEFTGSINRIFDPINQCNFVHVHVRTDVIPFQVKWPEKTADPLNRRPNKADSTVYVHVYYKVV